MNKNLLGFLHMAMTYGKQTKYDTTVSCMYERWNLKSNLYVWLVFMKTGFANQQFYAKTMILDIK